MKKKFITSLILLASLSAFAKKEQLPQQSVTLLDVASNCSDDLSELAKKGRVGSITLESSYNEDEYTVEFVAGGFAPSFKTYSVGKLIMTRVFQRPIHTGALDAQGGSFKYRCWQEL